MDGKENLKTNELKLQIGDYVYLQRKFKPIFEGPFALNNILSSPIVMKRHRNIFGCVVVHLRPYTYTLYFKTLN